MLSLGLSAPKNLLMVTKSSHSLKTISQSESRKKKYLNHEKPPCKAWFHMNDTRLGWEDCILPYDLFHKLNENAYFRADYDR